MDEQRRPRSREKRVINEGKGVEKKGEGLGTGPVNNTVLSVSNGHRPAGAVRTDSILHRE